MMIDVLSYTWKASVCIIRTLNFSKGKYCCRSLSMSDLLAIHRGALPISR